jgi:hypothetical protein
LPIESVAFDPPFDLLSFKPSSLKHAILVTPFDRPAVIAPLIKLPVELLAFELLTFDLPAVEFRRRLGVRYAMRRGREPHDRRRARELQELNTVHVVRPRNHDGNARHPKSLPSGQVGRRSRMSRSPGAALPPAKVGLQTSRVDVLPLELSWLVRCSAGRLGDAPAATWG